MFYHGLTRKYVAVFGTCFNDIKIQRVDNSAQRIQTLEVPIAYGPKEKWLIRIRQDPEFDRPIGISLPRMAFEITGFQYATDRKLNSTNRNVKIYAEDTNRVKTQYVPVPYDITFTLYIMASNADDGVQILEQIIPYFTPEWTVAVNLVPEMGIVQDIPIIMQGISVEDGYEGDFQTRRTMTWNIDFTMRGLYYGPSSHSGVIKRSIVDLHPDTAVGTPVSDRITLVPGLTANNQPTSNSAESIPYSQINEDDPWGFAFDYYHYEDGADR